MKYGKIYRNILVMLLIAILAFLSLYEIYMQEGIIGRTWDWGGIGEFPGSFEEHLRSSFYVWYDKQLGGMEAPFNSMIIYSFYYYMLSLVTPYLFSKILVTMLLFLTGINFYFFLRSIKVNEVLSFIFALIYMFNTRIYSIIILGHMPMILFFGFFPLVVLQVIKFGKTKKIKHLIISTIIIALTNVIVQSIILMFSIAVFLAIIFIKCTEKGNTAVKCMLSCCIFILLSSYFLLPFISAISNSDYSVHVDIPMSKEASSRMVHLPASSLSFDKIFSFYHTGDGKGVEHINVFWDKFLEGIYWRVAVISSFAMIIFYYFMVRWKRLRQFELFLITIFFIAIFILSGSSSLFGKTFYSFFSRELSWVYSAFSNLWRYSPLLIFSWCVLFCLSINYFWEMVKGKRIKYIVQLYLLFFLGIYLYPWFIHSFTERVGTDLTNPFKLQVNKVYEGDKKVYRYLQNETGDYRVMFLPPPAVIWPGDTKYGFCWNSASFKKNTFFEWYNHSRFYNEGVSALYTRGVDSNFSKMLGLGNVKYLISPYYENNYFSYVDFYNHEVDYKKIEKNNLMELLRLNKMILNPIFSQEYGIDIFRNTDYLPHIFSVKSLYFVK